MFNSQELAAIHVFKAYKSSYRAEYLARLGLGEYTADNPIIKSLIAAGVVKVSKNGSLTPLSHKEMSAILQNYEYPEEYKGKLENGWMTFGTLKAALNQS